MPTRRALPLSPVFVPRRAVTDERAAGDPGGDLEPLTDRTARASLGDVALSAWFDPFLPIFAWETIQCGGEATVVRHAGRVAGLLLTDPNERVASAFARELHVARRVRDLARGFALYAEVDLGSPRDELTVYRADLERAPPVRLRHRVTVVRRGDLERLASFAEEGFGPGAGRWVEVADDAGERCLTVELDGTIAGAAWVQVAGCVARLHGLLVRPGFRGLGIGTDLVGARLLYARRAGVRTALSEIADQNAASRAAAARCGMTPGGRMYLHLGPSALGPRSPGPAAARSTTS